MTRVEATLGQVSPAASERHMTTHTLPSTGCDQGYRFTEWTQQTTPANSRRKSTISSSH
jgi:hypothetical protein